MVFEVPWDFFRGPRGPISAPGHDRIFSTGDFSHLWGALHRHASRFSGLFFGSKRGFKWYVLYQFSRLLNYLVFNLPVKKIMEN